VVCRQYSPHIAHKLIRPVSGIFGYINYLVEKDRKFILDTLVNGQLLSLC
jgi:hypothetical protein